MHTLSLHDALPICNNVSEFNDHEISDLVDLKMKGNGFTATHQTLEVMGHCNNCK